jgi:flagellar hook-associated protein 3 FlgL
MSDRITPAMVTSATIQEMNASLAALTRTTNELSSGKTILEPSDNPYGTSRVIDLQSQLAGLSSYASNAQDGIAWENTAGSAMSSMNEVVQRVRQLLVQSANGTINQSNLNAAATEVEQLTDGVKQDANTQYAGQYVFSGTLTTTAPYQQGANDEFQGNAETVSRTVGPGASVTITSNISALLGNGQASGDGKLLDTLRTIAQDMRSGTDAGKAALGSSDLANLDGNIATLSQLQAAGGSATNQLQTALSRSEDLQTTITASLSSTEDANIANTSIAYANEQAGYQATLRAAARIVQESLLDFLK